MTPTITAILISTLGADYSGLDADRICDVFMADKVGSESYSEETFTEHIEAIDESGEGYIDFVDGLRSNPATLTMYAFFIGQGSKGIYALLDQMGNAGLLKKDKVASAAKIATKQRAERPWFRKIWDDLGAEAYTFIEERFEARLEEYKKQYPEIDAGDINTFKDLLFTSGKSTLFVGVTKATEPNTNQECSVALGWRNDVHSAARNGGWDSKLNNGAGGYTKKYKEKAAKAEAAKAAKPDDDGDDEGEE